MALTSALYGHFLELLGDKTLNLAADDLNVALFTDSYTPDPNNDFTYADTTDEATGAGYTTGGAALTGRTWAYDPVTQATTLYAAPVGWTALTTVFRYAVVYFVAGPLLGYLDYGSPQTLTNVNFVINFNAGLFRLPRT